MKYPLVFGGRNNNRLTIDAATIFTMHTGWGFLRRGLEKMGRRQNAKGTVFDFEMSPSAHYFDDD